MSQLEVDKIIPQSGTTLTLGDTGDTINFGSGVLPNFENLTVTGDLTVDTNSLYVDSANNRVGIGTASPSYNLDVSGNMRLTNDIRLDNGTADSPQVVLVSSGYDDWYWDNSSGSLRAINATTERMRINNAGNVGIGTNSPDGKLHIDGASDTVTGLVFEAGSTTDNQFIEFQNTSGLKRIGIEYDNTSINLNITDRNRNKLVTIREAGNVGIGTDSPSVRLHVKKLDEALRLQSDTVDSALYQTLYNSAGTRRMYQGYAGASTSDSLSLK